MFDVPHHSLRRGVSDGRAEGGKAGQQGNSVGAYICSDLACSLYVRGKRDAGACARLHETVTLEEKIERTVANVAAFVANVTTA